jgi:hypothetical protein
MYGSFLHKYRRYDGLRDMIKLGTYAVFFIWCSIAYLYFISMSSTRGYFLRKENQNLSTISFQYEILKTKLLDYKQQNWDSVQGAAFKRDVVDVNAEVVRLPGKPELGFLK